MRAVKQSFRNHLRQRRRKLSDDEQHDLAECIARGVLERPYFKAAHHIGLYLPFDGEVLTQSILKKALQLHKCCYVPVLAEPRLQFIKIDNETPLVKNRFGILEPSYPHMKSIPPQSLDVVLVPLVAFDKQCHRLGMGAGFYDITFAFRRRIAKPKLVGLAYDFQKVFRIPRNKLDLSLDEVVTERQIYMPQIQ